MAAPFDLVAELAPGAGPLDLIGDTYMRLDGSGADASTPDVAALDITGDIDIRWEGYFDNWATSTAPTLVAKWNATGNQRSYLFVINSGYLALLWSTDGTLAGALEMFTDVPVPLISGRLAVRVTLDVNNGAAGRTAVFYTAPTIAGSWTQLGSTQTIAGTTSIFSSSAVLQVGDSLEPTLVGSVNGRVYAAEVRNGIAGSAVANPNFGAQTPGAPSFADATGKTWTLNGTAEIIGYEWESLPQPLEASWSYGRDDELDPHSPGQAKLRFKNDDRSLDPDHAAGPWFGLLGPRVPVRLRSTWSALDLPGATGALASTPDKAALGFTGDIDIRARLAMDDWTPAGFGQFVVSQWDTPTNEGWFLAVLPAGTLQLTFTTDGSTDLNRISTVGTGFTDGTDHWIRATLDVNNGAAGHDVRFYTSTDGLTWTQLGATVTTAGTVTRFNSTANLIVGATADVGLELAGQVRYAEVRNGIDGTIVANPDFMSVSPGATTFVDGSANTWTVNGTAVVAIDAGLVIDEFYGFVGDNGWQQELNPPATAECVVDLVDLLAVLAGGYKLPDVFDQAILARDPLGYWVLDSPGGSESVGDRTSSGHDGTVIGDVQFDQAPIASGHGQSAFFDGDGDRINITRSPILPDPSSATVVATLAAQSVAVLNLRTAFVQSNGNANANSVQIHLDLSGHIVYQWLEGGGGVVYDGGSIMDSTGHLVFGQGDGIAVDTATISTATTSGIVVRSNGVGIGGYIGINPTDHWHGRIGAVAAYGRRLSEAERQLILDGYHKLNGFRSDEQISWALDRIGVPAELRNLDQGTVIMGPASTGGRDALEWVREVTATEQGEWRVDHRDGGKLRFVNRYARFLNTRSVSAQETFSDDPAATNVVRVERDDLDLVPNNAADVINQATVTWRDGSEIVEDAASKAQYGPRPRQIDTQATTATQARAAGEWLTSRYAQPKTTVRGVGVHASAALIGFRAVRELRIGDRVTNRLHPQQVGSATTKSLFIEKVSHKVGKGVSWRTTWRTSAVDTFTPWIWGVSAWDTDTFWG